MKRPHEEILAEIKALKALKPVGQFARKTTETISVIIDALEDRIDTTSDEFDELPDEQQMAALDAINWLHGHTNDRPSEGWGKLVA